MRPVRVLSALVAAAFALPVSGQAPPLPFFQLDHQQTSGWVQNDGARADVIAEFIVSEVGTSSLRLEFDEVHLAGSPFDGSGSWLVITGLQDGYQQILDAQGLQQWNDSSAYFNGDAVHVALWAQPGSGPNLVSVGGLQVAPVAPSTYASQCGPTDDRQPSNDPRVARLLPSGCTAWMIDDCAKCFLSAGHCGTGNNAVEFNVPFSNGNGSWNHPPPSDQYSIDPSSMQANNSFGNDWMYFGTFPNSTTSLTAYAAQGDAFELANPPAVSGNDIRITGHGTDSTPNSTYNQVQQTHVGPFVNNGSVLQYQTDTTGGNSGSPIIWEQTDQAIGVHTNAGCNTSGSGANQGTPITQGQLQAALANPQGVCASGGFGGALADLGHGKADFPYSIPPKFAGCGSLEPLSDYELFLELPNLFGTTSTAFFILGVANISVPFKGGTLVPSPDAILPVPLDPMVFDPSITLQGVWPAGIPSGTTLYAHWWVFFDSAVFDGYLASNAISMTTP